MGAEEPYFIDIQILKDGKLLDSWLVEVEGDYHEHEFERLFSLDE